MPLAWAHAEYIKLRRSLRDGRIYDMPPQTVRRYLVEKVESSLVLWRPDHRRSSMPAGRRLRIELQGPALIRWSSSGENRHREQPTRDSGLGVHYADLATEDLTPADAVQFTVTPIRSAWRAIGGIEWIRPATVRIEGSTESQGGRARHHVAAGAGADGVANIR
jgi:hypothetical protein